MASSPRPRSRSSAAAAAVALTFALAAGLGAAAPAAAAEYAVLVSPDVKVDSLSFAQVRQLFVLNRHFWSQGQSVTVLLPPANTPTREFLVGRIYRANEGLLRRMVVEKLFRGDIDAAPRTVTSDADAGSLAASGRGVIALVAADTPVPAGVRVVPVGGRRPGESGYPLRD